MNRFFLKLNGLSTVQFSDSIERLIDMLSSDLYEAYHHKWVLQLKEKKVDTEVPIILFY